MSSAATRTLNPAAPKARHFYFTRRFLEKIAISSAAHPLRKPKRNFWAKSKRFNTIPPSHLLFSCHLTIQSRWKFYSNIFFFSDTIVSCSFSSNLCHLQQDHTNIFDWSLGSGSIPTTNPNLQPVHAGWRGGNQTLDDTVQLPGSCVKLSWGAVSKDKIKMDVSQHKYTLLSIHK